MTEPHHDGTAAHGAQAERPGKPCFGLGKIGRDQVADYARRKGASIEHTERWLAPNLDYQR